MLYDLIVPETPPLARAFAPLFVDVRDVARSLVAALDSPPTAKVGRKRILVSSEWPQAKEILGLLREKRPQVADRLSEALKVQSEKESGTAVKQIIDPKRVKEILGIETMPWQKTILDAVDTILELEQEWKVKGWTPAYVYP